MPTRAPHARPLRAPRAATSLGAYVLHTFALSFFIASIALWAVGIETKGRVLEQITAAEQTA